MVLALAAVPLVAGALLGRAAPGVARRLPPALGVRVLSLSGVAIAAATGFCLAVVAFDGLARIPPVAAVGQWSAGALGLDDSPSPVAGAAAALVVVLLLLACLRRSALSAVQLVRATALCRGLGQPGGSLVVVDDPRPEALAVPGLHGRILVTTGMLRALTPAERRVVLAHERAHLAGHHQLYIQASGLAAAANPLLRPVADQVRLLAERWADEEAATAVGDRRLVARALVTAALARSTAPTADLPGAALGAALDGVPARAAALRRPAPPPRHALAAAVLVLALVSTVASAWVGGDTEDTFEQAHAAYVADPTGG